MPFLSRETGACLDPEAPRGLWGSPGSRSVAKHLGGARGSGAQAPSVLQPHCLIPSPCGATWVLLSSAGHCPHDKVRQWDKGQGSPCTSHPGPALNGPALPGGGGAGGVSRKQRWDLGARGRGGARQRPSGQQGSVAWWSAALSQSVCTNSPLPLCPQGSQGDPGDAGPRGDSGQPGPKVRPLLAWLDERGGDGGVGAVFGSGGRLLAVCLPALGVGGWQGAGRPL